LSQQKTVVRCQQDLNAGDPVDHPLFPGASFSPVREISCDAPIYYFGRKLEEARARTLNICQVLRKTGKRTEFNIGKRIYAASILRRSM
jgi:hypothetical protein